MKRIFIFVTVVLFAAGAAFAEEATLIDFSKLVADIYVDQGDPAGGAQTPNQNRQTLMDFGASKYALTLDADSKRLMKTSLALPNWTVVLASSARNVTNQVRSYTHASKSTQWGTVLGVRVHFPVEPFNSWAKIAPPFTIPAFDFQTVDADGNLSEQTPSSAVSAVSRFEGGPDADDTGKAPGGYGVVKNVGTIKSIAVNAYGLNFPHSLSAILLKGDGTEQIVFLGYLNYDGWGELTWNNPAYVSEVRNRELRLYPFYPATTPSVKFGGFLIQRDADKEGGDFIAYFKDVKIIYDKAVLDTPRDIDDEAEWGLIIERENAKQTFEQEKFGQNQVQQFQEKRKQAPETGFTPTPTND
ncbi:flagellar filament outer layer protein [Spirochaetia bacterium]|nr:flagellar filament outer layer protein [Spirochaetia bacterium]